MPRTPRYLQPLLLSAIILAVIGLLSYGYYLQFVEYLDPCPLCITQRLFYYLLGFFALFALFRWRHVIWQKSFAVLMFLACLGGIATAGRQVWLQHLPPELVPECGPGLQYWLDNMPLLNTLQLLFKGDGNCAEVDWRFMGLSIAEWSLLWFVVFTLVSLYLFACRRRLTTPV